MNNMNEFYEAGNEAIRNILDGEDCYISVQRAAIKYNQDEKYLRRSVESMLDVHFGRGADSKL